MFVCSEMVENADAAQAMDLLQRFNANVIVNLFFWTLYLSKFDEFFFFCSHILFLFFLSKVLLREGLKLKKKVT